MPAHSTLADQHCPWVWTPQGPCITLATQHSLNPQCAFLEPPVLWFYLLFPALSPVVHKPMSPGGQVINFWRRTSTRCCTKKWKIRDFKKQDKARASAPGNLNVNMIMTIFKDHLMVVCPDTLKTKNYCIYTAVRETNSGSRD